MTGWTGEVYRGPQSAAFGRSTFAGAINYVTADATEEFEGETYYFCSDACHDKFKADPQKYIL